ncbi:type I restriction endonuclease subunit R [Thalassotalea sp. ND16A]|uniref:type I restriction endonuclease subunit R n=1 Tax=Thalassotalea sp. ND16A TaxID=1535422 RepID=UPI00051A7345|nr:DEAD/DEAH box helicase family protein [Thalassotalea sp. ND16A]KGK00167.1 hypothetical protein ND16A_3638 [Thalassotalea sp. ND16A]
MVNQNPEQIARDKIDEQLEASGWAIQSNKAINFAVGEGQAVREYQTDAGPADYVLFVDGQAIGVIEAKPQDMGHKITSVELQTEKYANAKLKWINNEEPLPFLYEATGEIIHFTDQRDPKPRARELFTFQRPEALKEQLKNVSSLRKRLTQLPELNPTKVKASELGLRNCQEIAITNLENSFRNAKPRALIQMATGSGKTYTAITSMYRLLKHAKGKRILFLVDTKNLGEQAEQEMLNYTPSDDSRKFTELYAVQRLKSSYVPKDAQVCICTIQRMYSILRGEDLDETAEEQNPAESLLKPKEPVPVAYNPKVPVEFFDFIFIDECHRSIYNLWMQVLDYFDSFLIGLTATPDNRTYGFFKKNVVSNYDHEKAVADGVNVGNEVYLIETKVTKVGGQLKAKQPIQHRERQTRRKRWEQQDEDESYTGKQLDKNIVNPDQILTVIQTFKNSLPSIFPDRQHVPKTLVFAKSDSHADDIIQTVREEFNEGNDFCKKITYRVKDGKKDKDGNIIEVGEDPRSVLSQFRSNYNPRIAVTVDMIATGTDVKPLECLLFMRDVKSRNYFEQMKGRGTRTLNKDGMQKVTPDAKCDKTHYVIVDAIGVTQSLKTASQPLITKPSVPIKDLAMSVMMGVSDSDTVSSLAGRLARLDKQLDKDDKRRIEKVSGGIGLTQIVSDLFEAIDADKVEEQALLISEQPIGTDPGDDNSKKGQQELVSQAAKVINGELIETIVNIRKEKDQKIDHENLDEVTSQGWSADTALKAQTLRDDFNQYLKDNIDAITALEIYFSQPHRRREVTFDMVRDLLDKLKTDKPQLAPIRVWDAYAQLDKVQGKHPEAELQMLVALIRRVSGIDESLSPFSETVKKHFQRWVLAYHAGEGEKFNEQQMAWLRMIRDHIANSFHFEIDDLDMAPFDAEGGLGRMYQLFGDEMNNLINTLNEELAA